MYSMNLRDRILGLLNDGGKPVSVRELVQKLALEAQARDELPHGDGLPLAVEQRLDVFSQCLHEPILSAFGRPRVRRPSNGGVGRAARSPRGRRGIDDGGAGGGT